MIGFLLALLLWMVGQGPAPAPAVHGVTVAAPASVVPPARRAPRSETHRPPAAAPTVAELAPTSPPAALATTDQDPSDRMCYDPVDCPRDGEPPSSAPVAP